MTPREKNQIRMFDLLSKSKCLDCGEDDMRVLTFDHRDPAKKKATISALIYKGHSWDVIEKERKKTDIVCHNCHIRREGIRGNGARQQYWENNK